MSVISSMVSQLSNYKTLEQEIIEVLESVAPRKLSSAEILAAIPNPPDRETLTREIYNLSQSGVIKRAGEIPSPPGTPRQTVAVYTLPQAVKVQGQQDQVERRAGRKDIISFLEKQSVPVGVPYICDQLGVTVKSVSDVLSQLRSLGVIDRAGKARSYNYFLVRQGDQKTPSPITVPKPEAEQRESCPVPDQPPSDSSFEIGVFSDGRVQICSNDNVMILKPSEALQLKTFLSNAGPLLGDERACHG